MELYTYKKMAANEQQHWWFKGRRSILKKVLSSIIQTKDVRILELGSGTGGNYPLLSEFGKVTGLEKESLAIELAQRYSSDAFKQASLPEDINALDEAYDVYVMLDVLEHIQKDLETLKNLRAKIQQGQLVITVPAYQFLWSAHDEIHHHQRRYNRKNLRKLLRQAGFEIQYLGYYNTILFPLALGKRLLSKLFRQKQSEDDKLPPRWLNGLFCKLFSFERHLIPRFQLPFGLSLMAIVRISDDTND